MVSDAISPSSVRYVKLGEGGDWEEVCKERGILRFGYESADPETLEMCREGRWDDLATSWRNAGGKGAGVATRFKNETRFFFDDPGETLWVTFMKDHLYWGFLEPGEPQRFSPGNASDLSSFRAVRGGWRCTDLEGRPLTKTSLPGTITKLGMFRGTSCAVDVADRLVLRINGQRLPEVARVEQCQADLKTALVPLIRQLDPRDFEVLIDMIFTSAGWRRMGDIGKQQPIFDLDLELPLTRERAFVQVKSNTNQREFESYAQHLETMDSYQRMFFVHHTGQITNHYEFVTLLGAEEVAAMVIESGLIDWVVQKVS